MGSDNWSFFLNCLFQQGGYIDASDTVCINMYSYLIC